MVDFRATMESGTVWEYRDGIMHIDSARTGKQTFMPMTMKVVDRNNDFENVEDTWAGFLEVLRSLPPAEIPEVGKSFYAGSHEVWRLSTPVAKVEILGTKNHGED